MPVRICIFCSPRSAGQHFFDQKVLPVAYGAGRIIPKKSAPYVAVVGCGAVFPKEEKTGVWTRKVKVKVLGDEKKKVTMTATRTCDKDGGTGTFSLEKAVN